MPDKPTEAERAQQNSPSFSVLNANDMRVLEQIGQRIVNKLGTEFSYHTSSGVTVRFEPIKSKEENNVLEQPNS